MRQLQQNVPPLVGQGEHLAALEFGDQARLDADIGPGEHAERHALLVEPLLQLRGPHADSDRPGCGHTRPTDAGWR